MKRIILLCHVVLLALLSLLTGCRERRVVTTKDHVAPASQEVISSSSLAEVFLRTKNVKVRFYLV